MPFKSISMMRGAKQSSLKGCVLEVASLVRDSECNMLKGPKQRTVYGFTAAKNNIFATSWRFYAGHLTLS